MGVGSATACTHYAVSLYKMSRYNNNYNYYNRPAWLVLDSSQKRSTAATEEATAERDPDEHVDGEPAEEAAGPSSSRGTEIAAAGTASGVAVTNRGAGSWAVSRPERNLLVVIHPWCVLRKSGADRQSEFPPPGFLELLKAKLLQAIHRETDRGQHRPSPAADVCRRRRDNGGGGGGQAIKCWFRYNAAAAFRGQRNKSIAAATASYPDGPAVFDFLTIRRRFAAPREAKRPSGGGARPTVPSAS